MAAVVLLSVLLFRGPESWRRSRVIVACACVVVANFGATQALSALHFAKSGYWGATAADSRDWWKLYSTLLSLPVQRDDPHVGTNNATMDMAASLSGDLRSMKWCIQQQEIEYRMDELRNYAAPWIFFDCLPGENRSKQYYTMLQNNCRYC
jgi:hypothetical protein